MLLLFFFLLRFNCLTYWNTQMSYLKNLPGKAWVAWLKLGRLHELPQYNIVYHGSVWLFAHSDLSSLRLWCLEIPGNAKFNWECQTSPQEKTSVCLQCTNNLTSEHQLPLRNRLWTVWPNSFWTGWNGRNRWSCRLKFEPATS